MIKHQKQYVDSPLGIHHARLAIAVKAGSCLPRLIEIDDWVLQS